jgi:hypothetical protein
MDFNSGADIIAPIGLSVCLDALKGNDKVRGVGRNGSGAARSALGSSVGAGAVDVVLRLRMQASMPGAGGSRGLLLGAAEMLESLSSRLDSPKPLRGDGQGEVQGDGQGESNTFGGVDCPASVFVVIGQALSDVLGEASKVWVSGVYDSQKAAAQRLQELEQARERVAASIGNDELLGVSAKDRQAVTQHLQSLDPGASVGRYGLRWVVQQQTLVVEGKRNAVE